MKRNFKNILTACAVILAGTFLTNSCDKINPETPEVPEPINWTMAVVNEGWFGHEGGSVNVYNEEEGTWTVKAYQAANPGKEFGTTTTVGVQNGDKIYFISKDAPHMIEAEAGTMKHLSSLTLETQGEQAMNFVAKDANKGFLSTGNGIYEVELNPVTLGKKIAEGSCGDMIFTEGKLYYRSGKDVLCYDSVKKETSAEPIASADFGFTLTDGYVWAASKNSLIKIDTKTNVAEELPIGCEMSWNAWAYTPSQLCASKDGKNIFFTSKNTIKKSDLTGKTEDFYTLPKGRSFYGARLALHPEKEELYIITAVDWTNENYIEVINSSTGEPIKTIVYTESKETNNYWFPSQVIFIR